MRRGRQRWIVGALCAATGLAVWPAPIGAAEQSCEPVIGVASDSRATIATFADVGSCEWAVPEGVTSVWVLVVGGGGGGGVRKGGGGGGGGVVEEELVAVTPGQRITVAVGGGGDAGSSAPAVVPGLTGEPSAFGSISAIGGGGGASDTKPATGGGSGGGGSSGGGRFGFGTQPQGYRGASFGGGGGADGAPLCRDGGDGAATDVLGTVTRFGAGGGGAATGNACPTGASGLGGRGGGGPGASTGRPALDGKDGTGGGGGGALGAAGAGSGGSGVVIVRYGAPRVHPWGPAASGRSLRLPKAVPPMTYAKVIHGSGPGIVTDIFNGCTHRGGTIVFVKPGTCRVRLTTSTVWQEIEVRPDALVPVGFDRMRELWVPFPNPGALTEAGRARIAPQLDDLRSGLAVFAYQWWPQEGVTLARAQSNRASLFSFLKSKDVNQVLAQSWGSSWGASYPDTADRVIVLGFVPGDGDGGVIVRGSAPEPIAAPDPSPTASPVGSTAQGGGASSRSDSPGSATPAPSPTPTASPTPTPLAIAYTDRSFTQGADGETLLPSVTGGSGSTNFSLTSGTLPTGVSLDASTGALTGPAAATWQLAATELMAGEMSVCARVGSTGVRCWGWNSDGQLGDGTTVKSWVPVPVTGLSDVSSLASVSSAARHKCARTSSSAAYCWGENFSGEIGTGSANPTSHTTPVASTVFDPASGVSLGRSTTCGVVAAKVQCVGSNYFGQLATGNVDTPKLTLTTAKASAGIDLTGVTDVFGGNSHTCALISGAAYCWGLGTDGQLGNGSQTNKTYATAVTGSEAFSALSVGRLFTCGVKTNKTVMCWGKNANGQLGDGTTTTRSSPVSVGALAEVTGLAAGSDSACAIKTDKTVWCWGNGGSGQMGNGTDGGTNSTPVRVTSMVDAEEIVAAGTSYCVRRTSGAVSCWGSNSQGELGQNPVSTPDAPTPIDVSGFAPQPGFPATVTITATDGTGSASTTFVLSYGA